MDRLTLFWIFHLIFLTLFCLEMVFVCSIWLRGRLPGVPLSTSRWRKAVAGLGYLLRLIFSRRLWVFITTTVSDGLVHRRLYRVDLRRWGAHIAVFGSLAILGFLSTITGVAVEITPKLFPADHFFNTNIIATTLRDVDHPVIAFANDFFGLVMLAGLLFMIYRRYILKDPQLRTAGGDTAILVLLTALVVSGYWVEIFRLLAVQPFVSTAGWAFIGYPFARLIQATNLPWPVLYNASFWLHFLIANAILFYAPFSRFAHVIMSPLIVAVNATEEATA